MEYITADQHTGHSPCANVSILAKIRILVHFDLKTKSNKLNGVS